MSAPLLTWIVDLPSAWVVCTSQCFPDTWWKTDRSPLFRLTWPPWELWVTISEESLLCVNLVLGGDSLEDSVHVFLHLCSFLIVLLNTDGHLSLRSQVSGTNSHRLGCWMTSRHTWASAPDILEPSSLSTRW